MPVQDSYTYTVTKTSADNEFVAYYQEKTPETVEVLLQIQYADVEAPETILKNANTDVMAVKAGDVITKTETDAFVASNLPSYTESYK